MKINTLGFELSGQIEEISKNVKDYNRGDLVFATSGFGFGAYAEYIALPATGAIALKPATLSFEEAASVPVGGITTLFHLKEKGKILSGQKVLIYRASGSVGSSATPANPATNIKGGNVAKVFQRIHRRSLQSYSQLDFFFN